ncbi:MAG TPA: hypothetical protein VIH22_10085 [Cyclobacteriaceae bacterium]
MNDTPDHIHKKQLEIILSKTPGQRFLMGLQMMEDVRQLVLSGIRKERPGISDKELKIAFISRYYKNDLSEERLKDVIAWIVKK